MTLITLFQKIAGKQKKRQADRVAGYRSLVANIADGKEPDAEGVEAILNAAGKSLDELRDDVELMLERRRLREKMDAVPKLAGERKRIEKKIAEADAVLEMAEQQHEEATYPLHCRLEEIKRETHEGDAAERRLVETCNDPILLTELHGIRNELVEATGRRSDLQREIRDLQQWATSDREEIPHAKTDQRAEDLKVRVKQREAQAEKRQCELAELEERIDVLEIRQRQIRVQMLLP